MRILYVGRNAKIGGGSTFRLNIARGLIKRGHECWLAAWPGEVLPRYREAGIGYVWTPPPPWGGPWILRAIRKYSIDLVHASNPSPGAAAEWACKRTGTPMVMSIHGLLSPKHKQKTCLQRALKIITFEEAAVSHLERRHSDVVDVSKIALLRRPIEHRPHLPPEDEFFHIAHIGRLSKRKGQNALDFIEAFRRFSQEVPEARLDVLGDGTMLAEVRQAAQAYNAERDEQVVQVHGSVPNPSPIVGRAHVLVGASYCALEAIMQGVAVIGAGFWGYGTITRDNLLNAMRTNFGDTNMLGETVTWEMTPENFLTELKRLRAAWTGDDETERLRYWRLDEEIEHIHSIDAVAEHIESIYREALDLAGNGAAAGERASSSSS